MSQKYKFLDVVFSTNCSDDKESIKRLSNALNDIPGVTFVNYHDNGGQFLINLDSTDYIISALNTAGFIVIQTAKMVDTKSLIAIIKKTTSQSFQNLDDARMKNLFD